MRTNIVILSLLAATPAILANSWFGSDEPSPPTTWSQDQYNKAQKSFQNVKDSTFDTWSDSRLREFLLEQGVVEPSGPRESLVLAAKGQYKAYTNAASSFASQATAMYDSATNSAESLAAQATAEVLRKADESRDYVWSTWDDNQLRDYLVEKGLIKSKSQKTREEMIGMMGKAYNAVTDPVWKAWSDSYMVRSLPSSVTQ